jgi:hypothetical protein
MNNNNDLNNIVMDYFSKSGNTYNRNIKLPYKYTNSKFIKLLQNIENATEITFVGECTERFPSQAKRDPSEIKIISFIFKVVFEEKNNESLEKHVILLKLIGNYPYNYRPYNTPYKHDDFKKDKKYIPYYYTYTRFDDTYTDKRFIKYLFMNVSDDECEKILKHILNIVIEKNRENVELVSIKLNDYVFGSDYKLVRLNDLINNESLYSYNDYNDPMVTEFADIMYKFALYITYVELDDNTKLQLEVEFKKDFYKILIKANILFYLLHTYTYQLIDATNILIVLPNNIKHILHNINIFAYKKTEDTTNPSPTNHLPTYQSLLLLIENFKHNYSDETAYYDKDDYINPYVQIIKPHVEFTTRDEGTGIALDLFYEFNYQTGFARFDQNKNHSARLSNNIDVLGYKLQSKENNNYNFKLMKFLDIRSLLEYKYIRWLHDSQLKLLEAKYNEKYKIISKEREALNSIYIQYRNADNLKEFFNIQDNIGRPIDLHPETEVINDSRLIVEAYIINNTICEYNPFHKKIEYEFRDEPPHKDSHKSIQDSHTLPPLPPPPRTRRGSKDENKPKIYV